MRKIMLFLFAMVLFCQQAVAYTGIVAIGDSFSDGGNSDTAVISYYKLYGAGLNLSTTGNYRFTNGPTAVEYLATSLGLNSPLTFQNYAVGGATTEDMLNYMTGHLNGVSSLDAGQLYVINGGGNGIESFTAQQSAQNMIDMVSLLHSKGATNFLVLGLPAISEAPRFNNADVSTVQFLQDYTQDFNHYLTSGLAGLGLSTSANLTYFDTKAALDDGKSMASSLGFTNVVDACLVGTTACANPDNYVFWDDLHPTTIIHEYLGQRMYGAITAVPEADCSSLLMAGLGLLFLRRRI